MAPEQHRDARRQEDRDGQLTVGPTDHGNQQNNFCFFPHGDIGRTLRVEECGKFYEEMCGVAWILVVTLATNGNIVVKEELEDVEPIMFGTAFSIDEEGYLLTCAHNFPEGYQSFIIRSIDGKEYQSSDGGVKMVGLSRVLDHALLKIERRADSDKNGFKYAALAESGDLFCGQQVLQIGHPDNWYFTLMKGEVCYPCVGSVTLNDCPDGRIVRELNPDAAFESFFTTQPYRRARDVIRPDDANLNDLHPNAQLIQMSNSHSKMGSSGGPIFDNTGHIVGIMCFEEANMYFGIHVSMLKTFAIPLMRKDKRKMSEKPRMETKKASKEMKGKRKLEDTSKKRQVKKHRFQY